MKVMNRDQIRLAAYTLQDEIERGIPSTIDSETREYLRSFQLDLQVLLLKAKKWAEDER